MSNNLCQPDSTLLHVIVSRLQCPFQVEGYQELCSFYQREAFCPFGHRSDRIAASAIPPYICVDYLVGKCTVKHTWEVTIKHDSLVRCSRGYHPTGIQLLDLEVLDRKVTTVEPKQDDQIQQDQVQQDQMQQDQEQATEDHLKCPICLELMHSPYGIPSLCCHLFCHECIVEWHETYSQKHCPVCRAKSLLVFKTTSTDPILNEQAKLELLRWILRCRQQHRRDNQGWGGALRRARRWLRKAGLNLWNRLRMAGPLNVHREGVDFED